MDKMKIISNVHVVSTSVLVVSFILEVVDEDIYLGKRFIRQVQLLERSQSSNLTQMGSIWKTMQRVLVQNPSVPKDKKCVAVNIKRVEVPYLVEVGADSVVLDCEYSGAVSPEAGLVVKWFFNGSSGLVYQWIPPRRPQVIGLLKGKVDLKFKISEEPSQAYRAIKILNPTTDLSGNYTCVISTFMEEDRRTKSMLVYSPGQKFQFYQEKKYVFWVTLTCVAEALYPKPEMFILSRGKPLEQAVMTLKMDSWGLYSVTTTAVVHDEDVTTPWEEFVCTLRLPSANYTANRTTIYHPGLMPTAYIAAVEMEKHQERHANSSGAPRSVPLLLYINLLMLVKVINKNVLINSTDRLATTRPILSLNCY